MPVSRTCLSQQHQPRLVLEQSLRDHACLYYAADGAKARIVHVTVVAHVVSVSGCRGCIRLLEEAAVLTCVVGVDVEGAAPEAVRGLGQRSVAQASSGGV